MEWWEALRAGRRYVNPHAEPGGPRGSSPWCWKDPEQRVLWEGQSPQARRWLETNGAGWEVEEEEEEVVVAVREQVMVGVKETREEAWEEDEEEEKGGQQVPMGSERAVKQHPEVGAGDGTQGQVQAQAHGSPLQQVPLEADLLDAVLLQRRQPQQEPFVPPQPHTQQQQQQQQVAHQPQPHSQKPQPGPEAPPATAPAAQRLRHFAARAGTERARVLALLYGPKRAITKAAMEEELLRVVGLLAEIEAKGAAEDDVGSG